MPLDKSLDSPKGSKDFLNYAISNDFENYLPNDILVKSDRASMRNGLELRSPLLDHKIFDYTRSFEAKNFYNSKSGKQPLWHISKKVFGSLMHERPKTGFSQPLDFMFAEPARSRIEQLLNDHTLDKHKLISKADLRKKWNSAKKGSFNDQKSIFQWIALLHWLDSREIDLI